jgi:hypothetical protein
MGVALNDNASAYQYACTVARELMRRRETQTRYWRIKVYRDGEGPVFDILLQRSTRRSITFAASCAPLWSGSAKKNVRSRIQSMPVR